MREFLSQIDHIIFHFINTTMKNPVFDVVMPFITNEKIWIVPIIAASLIFLIFGKPRQRACVIIGLIVVAIVDPVAAKIIKPYFHRLRPFETIIDAHVSAGAAGFSFPSNHAVNTFAIATVIFYFARRAGTALLITAFVVGFSRIYCGVHYPFDVLAGSIFGIVVSSAVLFVYSRTKWNRELK